MDRLNDVARHLLMADGIMAEGPTANQMMALRRTISREKHRNRVYVWGIILSSVGLVFCGLMSRILMIGRVDSMEFFLRSPIKLETAPAFQMELPEFLGWGVFVMLFLAAGFFVLYFLTSRNRWIGSIRNVFSAGKL